MMKKSILWLQWSMAVIGLVFTFCGSAMAGEPERSWGQLIFVPVYPSVYIDERGRDLNMTSSLMVRNLDPEQKIQVLKADYHRADGTPVKAYLTAPITLAPLASTRILIKQGKDREHLEGASFLVEWTAIADAALPPIVEDITIGAEGTQGISFVRDGRIISEKNRN